MIKAHPEQKYTHMRVTVSDALCHYLAGKGYDTWETGVTSICKGGLNRVLNNEPLFADDYTSLMDLFEKHNVDYLDICRACDTDEDFEGWETV